MTHPDWEKHPGVEYRVRCNDCNKTWKTCRPYLTSDDTRNHHHEAVTSFGLTEKERTKYQPNLSLESREVDNWELVPDNDDTQHRYL